MAQTITIPSTFYPPGTHGPFELRQLPGNADGFQITLTRENWPVGADVVRLITEWSRDNRSSWQPIRDTTFDGGITIGRDGRPVLTSGITQYWPGENDGTGARRKLRGSDVRITAIVAQALWTAVTIEAI